MIQDFYRNCINFFVGWIAVPRIKTVIIALASATGEKTPPSPLPVPNKAPLARAKEGPKAPTQARSTEEGAEGPRRLGRTGAPREKSFQRKLKTASAIIRVFTKLKTRLSRKLLSWWARSLKICTFCLKCVSRRPKKFQVFTLQNLSMVTP